MPRRLLASLVLLACAGHDARALNQVRSETRTDAAVSAFGVDGRGVTIAILDRGIDWSHPDFIDADGHTRIRALLDMSGQNLCAAGDPAPVEYGPAQIDAALAGGAPIAERDAVGHGTATAGTAAGNGRALPDLRYRGIAPGADLVIVKLLSEGAPAHADQPAEAAFQGCTDQAIDWALAKMDALGQPGVLIINSGTQWGPIDGTSAVSRKLDAAIGADRAGRVVVIPGGDEGSLPNHAGADYSGSEATIGIAKATAATAVMSAWYSGTAPAEVRVAFADGATAGPVAPGRSATANGITIINYAPGTAFYPWTSTSGDGAVWIGIDGHATTGSVTFHGLGASDGHVDLYGDVTGANLTPVISVTDHQVPGRLSDYAATRSAIVSGNHVDRTQWIDLDGNPQSITDEGAVGDLWLKSSAGPTRDGRVLGVDVSAPGQNLFAPVGLHSYWETLRWNLPQDGNGYYVRFGGNSGAAPILVGAVALMLQANPRLSGREVRRLLRAGARADAFTGALPNPAWGYGKLDVYAAVAGARDAVFSNGFDGD